MNSLLIEIPTKDRPRTLGRCLAALLGQTYQDYDLLIVDDLSRDPVGSDLVTAEWLKRHQNNREVWVEKGIGIGQVYSHNMALWQRPWRDYEYILRLDDDVLLNIWAVQNMVHALELDPKVGAVSGLWPEHEENEDWFCDRDVPTRNEWEESPELWGKVVGGIVSNWHQRLYHDFRADDPTEPMEVEHLYGPWMYRTQFMRRVGGFPEIYSHGVHHGMETDASYRLHLAGYKLLVLPTVTGEHLRDLGGIRSLGLKTEHQQRQVDDPIRNERLRKMPGEYENRITVGVVSQHAQYMGGGPHDFFYLIEALQSCAWFDVYPLGSYMQPEIVKSSFGREFKLNRNDPPDEFDVLIMMGDGLEYFDEMILPPAKAKILYVFYPFGDRRPIHDELQAIVCNSNFVVDQVGKKWNWNARTIYPLVRKIKPVKKRNQILIMGRIDQWKGTLWLMEAFVSMQLDDWELHVAGAVTGSVQTDYIQQVTDLAKQHKDIKLHLDASQKEMDILYGRSKILWAAKGYMVDNTELMQEAEHFGLTPVEAMSARCIPLAYDLGGHLETTPTTWRWKTRDELIEKTFAIAENGEIAFPDTSDFHDAELHAERWHQAVLQANAGVVKLEPYESDISVTKKLVLAVVSDSPPPRRYTGFGIVTGQIVPSFVEAGFDVWYYAILDRMPARVGEFDFNFWPMQKNDPQGEKNLVDFLNTVKPDAIWSLYDAGNIYTYLVLRELGIQARRDDGSLYPIVAYFPVEGVPCPEVTGEMIEAIQRSDGKAITYCQRGANIIHDQFGLDVEWVHHGLDHADFRPYSDEDRRMLRQLINLDDHFVVGSFGVNKRVKQYDLLVHAARYLCDWGYGDDVIFYVHTEADSPILQGYPLKYLVKYHGVEHMFVWKPDTYRKRGGQYKGADYEVDTLEMARRLTMPASSRERGYLFGSFDIISRYNILDLYVDCSSVEGWNLPLGEAMACGVPAISVDDGLVRNEIYGDGVHMLKPTMFSTWHNGGHLAIVDPEDIARAIVRFTEEKEYAKTYAKMGLEVANRYKWADCREYMVRAVKEVLQIA